VPGIIHVYPSPLSRFHGLSGNNESQFNLVEKVIALLFVVIV